MVWRTRRRSDTAEHVLTSAIVAHVTGEKGSAAAAEVAVRGALARAELDGTIARIAVVSVGTAPFARVLGAALGRDRDVKVVAFDDTRPADADGFFLVLPDSTPPREAKAARDRLGRSLLGVVLAADAAPAGRDPDGDRLAQLTHREAALRRVTDAVERERELLEQHERALEERERAVEERERAVEAASAAQDDGLDDRAATLDERERELEQRERALETSARESATHADELAAALERAEAAEHALSERDEQLAALQAELEAAEPPEPEAAPEPEPEPEAPPGALGVHNLRDLEELVRDAQLRNDPRAEEMAYYVPLLREHAALDGRLPAQFDALVESIFG